MTDYIRPPVAVTAFDGQAARTLTLRPKNHARQRRKTAGFIRADQFAPHGQPASLLQGTRTSSRVADYIEVDEAAPDDGDGLSARSERLGYQPPARVSDLAEYAGEILHRPSMSADSCMPPPVSALCRWTSSGIRDWAAALAYSRESPSDFRPEILLWFFAQSIEFRPVVADYVCRVLLIYAGRTSRDPSIDTLAYATLDVLDRVQHRRCAPAKQRARECRMRKAEYLELRNAGERILLRCIRAGLYRYLEACGNQ